MVNKLDQALQFNQLALGLRAQRQQLLASNIANADTPNFKARDFDFKQALQSALKPNEPNAPTSGLIKTSAAHLEGNADTGSAEQGIGGVPFQYRGNAQGNVDGNTVDMDVERNQFADNALHYEANLTVISIQIRNLLAVIQG